MYEGQNGGFSSNYSGSNSVQDPNVNDQGMNPLAGNVQAAGGLGSAQGSVMQENVTQ